MTIAYLAFRLDRGVIVRGGCGEAQFYLGLCLLSNEQEQTCLVAVLSGGNIFMLALHLLQNQTLICIDGFE